MRRRTFLGMVGGASVATVVAPQIMRRAHAAFGEFPSHAGAAMLPEGVRAKRVLEVFLYGGLSQWETLYYVRNHGHYATFGAESDQWATACGGSNVARPFATDGAGSMVEIGPFAHRLWNRPDVVDRMRLTVQKHNLEPHEAAVPQALTGRPVGQPTAAGLGAHIQRARIDLSGVDRASPHAYVFSTGGISSDNVAAAAASGAHPGSARPLLIKTNNTDRLTTLLARPTVASREKHDALVAAYAAQYDARLQWPGKGRVRAPKVDDFNIAFDTTTRVDAIRNVLPPIARQGGSSCGTSRTTDIPLMAISAAAKLLTHPTEPASYVCVSDTGLYEASGGGGYDTHTDNASDTATNFNNMLASLLGIINAPGESDPAKISLDDTLIILNTEFGRTPSEQYKNGAPTGGRNHHPYGYVTAFIGGPTTKGITGAIDGNGNATTWATPAQNRIAALLALGIWPFAHEGFAVSDVIGASDELSAATLSMQAYLGRTA